jgi:3-hydroxymyristoyl/3-hydroxydecanoyl-(acyl carrier protein) dehydratase
MSNCGSAKRRDNAKHAGHCIAVKMHSRLDIAADHPSFSGHFPAFPVLPGAILLDEMLAAIQLARGIDLKSWHVSSVKFLDAVRPRDRLVLEHEAAAPGLIHFTIRVDSRKVASGTLHES